MKAMILAAGRGERMRPLTDACPKPMLKVHGKPLLEHHLIALAKAGITDVVINHAWKGDQIVSYFSDGLPWNVTINYRDESNKVLETAGGILNALPLLMTSDKQPFFVVNGDIFTSFDFSCLHRYAALVKEHAAHLFLVKNPEHNPSGDFVYEAGLLKNRSQQAEAQAQTYTFSGMGIYHPDFFSDQLEQKDALALGPLLRKKIEQGQISATVISDDWTDVGTPERLAQLNKR